MFRQAVRTYRPGFDPTKDQPFSHPLRLPSKIAVWPDGGPEAYERFLINQALLQSVSIREIDRLLPPYAEVRRVATKQKRDAAISEGASQEDLLALADNEITNLQDELKTINALLEEAERERDEAIAEKSQLRETNIHLNRRIFSLEEQLKQKGISITPNIPASLEGIEDWCRENLSGAVEMHNRAFQGLKKSHYEDVSLIYKSLLLLRDYYVPMRREGGIEVKQSYEDACNELGIEDQPTFSGHRYGEKGETYFIQYGGRRVLLDQHLKKGATRDERYCFRLYYFWDDANAQVVVGWLPSHLDTRLT